MTALQQFKPRVLSVNGVPMTTSLAVAEHFERQHRNVLAAIRQEIEHQDDLRFTDRHFIPTEYSNEQGKLQPAYKLTEVGFSLIAMGFTGAKAARWKRAYVEVFESMRATLQSRQYKALEELESRCRNYQGLLAIAEKSRDWYAARHEAIKKDLRSLRVEKFVADQIITEGGTVYEPNQMIVELKESLGEMIAANHAQREDFERQTTDIREKSRLDARKEYDRSSWPDPRRAAAHETLVRLLYAVNWVMSDACLIWALMQLRATVKPALPSTDPRSQAVNPGHSVTLREVHEVLRQAMPIRTLRTAALRLAGAGIVRQVEGIAPRNAMHLQIDLQAVLGLLVKTKETAEWVGANADTSLEAFHEGVHLLLPRPGESPQADTLLQPPTYTPVYQRAVPQPVELRIVVVQGGEEPPATPKKETIH